MPGAPHRFPIRFDSAYALLSRALLISPARSYVEIEGEEVRVRMAWTFRARFPRSAIASVELSERRPLSRGVHGLAGRWIVNGSGEGIVSLKLDPPPRGWVLGFPVRLRELLVSLEEPEAFMAACRPERPTPEGQGRLSASRPRHPEPRSPR